MKRKKIAAIINSYIADLEAGRAVHYWDAQHKPTQGERAGRIALLNSILAEVGHKEAGESDNE